MTKEQYIEFHKQFCTKMIEVTAAKNADYTGTTPDPFANFTSVETDGVCSTEVGFLVRMKDKFARIKSFVQKGVLEVKDEKVEDTLLDLANYCVLLAAYIKSKRPGAPVPPLRNVVNIKGSTELTWNEGFKPRSRSLHLTSDHY